MADPRSVFHPPRTARRSTTSDRVLCLRSVLAKLKLTPPQPSIVQTCFVQIQIMTTDSADLDLADSDSSSPDSGSESNPIGFFQPGKLYEESHYGTTEYHGRGTPHVHLAVCRL